MPSGFSQVAGCAAHSNHFFFPRNSCFIILLTGDDLIGLTDDSGHSRDSYTMTSRRRSKTKDRLKTVPKKVYSSARAETPSYQPTPKYKNNISARKKLSSSFAQTSPDNASQSETNDNARVVGSPSHSEDIAIVHGVSMNNMVTSVNTEDDGVQESAASPGSAKSGKRITGKRASKVKKNTKSKPAKLKKVTPRYAIIHSMFTFRRVRVVYYVMEPLSWKTCHDMVALGISSWSSLSIAN